MTEEIENTHSEFCKESGICDDGCIKPQWDGKEKPLSEKMETYWDEHTEKDVSFFWNGDVAEAVERLKEDLMNDKVYIDKMNICMRIDEIFGDLK